MFFLKIALIIFVRKIKKKK